VFLLSAWGVCMASVHSAKQQWQPDRKVDIKDNHLGIKLIPMISTWDQVDPIFPVRGGRWLYGERECTPNVLLSEREFKSRTAASSYWIVLYVGSLLTTCGGKISLAINYFFMAYPQNYFNCSTLVAVCCQADSGVKYKKNMKICLEIHNGSTILPVVHKCIASVLLIKLTSVVCNTL
jgi:hypothetical protein